MDPEKPETEGQPSPESEQPMVDVHEAAIEDLDAALENAQAIEKAEAEVPASSDESPEANPQSPDGADPKGPVVATKGADAAKPAKTYTQEEIQAILADNERQKKEGNQKELFIQHRGNELGALRAKFEAERREKIALRKQLMDGLEDRFSENPVQAIADRDMIKDIDAEIDGMNTQEERASRIVEAQTLFLRHVDTEKVSLDDVCNVLKSEGIEDRFIAQFRSNPWEFTTPEALVQMGKRAMDRKELALADNDRRILAKHVLHLNGELAKLKARPGQVMSQVQRNLNQTPSVTSASAVSPKAARDIDPTRMTMAELDSALRNAGMN